jgi:AcrR family transcriptional regulator
MSDGTLSAEMGSAERERLFEAMLGELADDGYESVSVERALDRCGISHEEFATEFEDKDTCLFAAYEQLAGRLVSDVVDDCDRDAEWPERIRAGLKRLLEELAAEPKTARVLVGSFPAIRPAAYRRYMGFIEAFAPFFSEGRRFSEAAPELPGEIEMLAIGAAETLIVAEIEAGRAAQLPTMLPSILFSLLVPFLGPDAASAAMQSAKAADQV